MSSADHHNGRITALDGVRALAIMLVFLRHTFKPFHESMPELFTIGTYNILTPFINGWVGVDLFFVLSGFLITRSFLAMKDTDNRLRRYALKRILRIVPAYYAVIIFSILILALNGGNTENMGWRVFYHAIFLQDYFPSDINVVFWSLGVEEKFYIIAFFLLPLVFKVNDKFSIKGVSLFLGGIMALGISLRYAGYVYYAPQNYQDFFLITRARFHNCWEPLSLGVWVSILSMNPNTTAAQWVKKNASKILVASFISLLVLLSTTPLMDEITFFDASLQPLIIALIMAGLVLGAVNGGAFPWLSHPVLAVISKMSYSLYLVHYILAPICFAFLLSTSLSGVSMYAFIAVFIVFYTVVCSAATAALHYGIERPFLKLKDKI